MYRNESTVCGSCIFYHVFTTYFRVSSEQIVVCIRFHCTAYVVFKTTTTSNAIATLCRFVCITLQSFVSFRRTTRSKTFFETCKDVIARGKRIDEKRFPKYRVGVEIFNSTRNDVTWRYILLEGWIRNWIRSKFVGHWITFRQNNNYLSIPI